MISKSPAQDIWMLTKGYSVSGTKDGFLCEVFKHKFSLIL